MWAGRDGGNNKVRTFGLLGVRVIVLNRRADWHVVVVRPPSRTMNAAGVD